MPTVSGEPPNMPDAETDDRHFVFVHGYNVNAPASRLWAGAMFKRLWWAGSRSRFTAVDWRGDESQRYIPTQGDMSPNYYVNVRHAFMTAPRPNAVNCHSPTEDVLANPTQKKVFGIQTENFGGAWSKQELFKGEYPPYRLP